jgi:D-alanine-D-alanine ligase
LATAGFQVSSLGLNTDPAPVVHLLRHHRPDAVFNLFEGIATQGQTEAFLAGLLEWYGIPYTGCPFPALVLARDKPRTKYALQGARLPTAPFFTVSQLPVPQNPLGWPVIVKPAAEDASIGLDQGSVVTEQHQLIHRVGMMLERYGPPVLVEQFIDGRECNVAVVEHPDVQALPISEIVFHPQRGDHWKIVTYDAKWLPGSADDLATTPQCPADLAPAISERLQELAVAAFRLFGCRQYARIDFRVNPAGEPFILEINPNPDYHPAVGLTRSLNAAGISHAEFTAHLVRALLGRREHSLTA